MLNQLPETIPSFLQSYLPEPTENRPFVTLTWAQSLDSRIAAEIGQQTKISHQETKAMTHYLRSKYDGILVGIGTILADDPKLNCRYNHNHPRPIIIDPHGKWNYSNSKLRQIVDDGNGKPPYIITSIHTSTNSDDIFTLGQQNGKIIQLDLSDDSLSNWKLILHELFKLNIYSLMVEGGATIINDLLLSNFIDSVIITIGPVFLGKNGVEVSPLNLIQLKNVSWWTGIQDSVIAGNLTRDDDENEN